MKMFLGGLLVGMLITWASNILFIGWYLRERDQVITELMAENKILLKREGRRIGDKGDSRKRVQGS